MSCSIHLIEQAMRGKLAFLKATNPWGGSSDDDDFDDDDAPDADMVADGLLAAFRSLPNYRGSG